MVQYQHTAGPAKPPPATKRTYTTMCYHDDSDSDFSSDDSADPTSVDWWGYADARSPAELTTSFTIPVGDGDGDGPILVEIAPEDTDGYTPARLLVKLTNQAYAADGGDQAGVVKTYAVDPQHDERPGPIADAQTLARAKAFAQAFVDTYTAPKSLEELVRLALGAGSRRVSALLAETHVVELSA